MSLSKLLSLGLIIVTAGLPCLAQDQGPHQAREVEEVKSRCEFALSYIPTLNANVIKFLDVLNPIVESGGFHKILADAMFFHGIKFPTDAAEWLVHFPTRSNFGDPLTQKIIKSTVEYILWAFIANEPADLSNERYMSRGESLSSLYPVDHLDFIRELRNSLEGQSGKDFERAVEAIIGAVRTSDIRIEESLKDKIESTGTPSWLVMLTANVVQFSWDGEVYFRQIQRTEGKLLDFSRLEQNRRERLYRTPQDQI
jgi:hypothetical protein